MVIDGVEGLDKVQEDNIGLKVVFAAKLKSRLEREYRVRASLGLQASALFFHPVCLDPVVHSFGDDRGEEFICDV